MTKEELTRLIDTGLAIPGQRGRHVGRNADGHRRIAAPSGSSRACRLRWLKRHHPAIFQDLVDGKFMKTRVGDGAHLYDLPAAEEAAGKRLSSKHVYLLHVEGTSRYKIGWGKRLVARIEKIRNASPFPVEVAMTIASDDPRQLEKDLHERFAHKRVWREWFELGPEELAYLSHCDK